MQRLQRNFITYGIRNSMAKQKQRKQEHHRNIFIR